VGDKGIIKTQKRKHNTSVVVAVYRTPCAIPPRNSNSRSIVHTLKDKQVLYIYINNFVFKYGLFIVILALGFTSKIPTLK
jgi:hypothetical protein